MAQVRQLILTCDVDGCERNEDVETLTFGYRGGSYEVELCKTHLGRAVKTIEPLTEYGRRTDTPPRRTRSVSSAELQARREHLEKVREWARENGYEVSDRGRVASNIHEAYEAANGKAAS